MPVGVSARGGGATDRLHGAKVMATTGTTCSWTELLLPQRSPAWGLCSQPRRRCVPGRRRQQRVAALKASDALLCVRAVPAGKPDPCLRFERRCCTLALPANFERELCFCWRHAYGAALGQLYTSNLPYESSLQAAPAKCESQQRLWLRQRRQRSRQRTGQTMCFRCTSGCRTGATSAA